ncbi:SRPBCC domain-containing protein [bacterium]|nr:SRPBCC domain-containing protein [bacterium]
MPGKKSNTLSITRVYDAPVKAVWDAWTDPQQVAKWWGPRGFTITTHSKDLRPGGHWDYTMHGPDGTDYPNTTVYHEVETHARLVYDHGGHKERPPLFRVTVVFSENRGKTTMEMSMTLPSPEAAEETRKFIKKAGGESTWDRLGEYLAEGNGKQRFIINRSFDAPIEALYEVWTDPKHFAQWLPPTGFTMEFLEANIRPGGDTFYSMTNGQFTMYGRAHYLALERPNTIVYTQEFCDANKKLSRHPGAPTWPATMLTTVTFTAEGPEQTRVTVCWEPHGETTSEELQTFIKQRGGMTQGWTGSFDKLEDYLAKKAK